MVLTRSRMKTSKRGLLKPLALTVRKRKPLKVQQEAVHSEVSSDTDVSRSCFTLLGESDNSVGDSISEPSTYDAEFVTPKKNLREHISGEEDNTTISPIRIKPFEVEACDNKYEEERLRRVQENVKALKDLDMAGIFRQYNEGATEEAAKRRIARAKQQQTRKLRRNLRMRLSAGERRKLREDRSSSSRLRNVKRVKYNTNGSIVRVAPDGSTEIINYSPDIVVRKVDNVSKIEKLQRKLASLEEDSEIDEEMLEREKKELEFINSLEDRYYTCEEYFTLKGVKPDLVQEAGAFTGWVKEEVRRSVGIAPDKETAWESNGGGKFSFKDPSGSGKSGSAKEMARAMLYKNPNSYFYRHCAPGIEHWQGDWTEEENVLFLEIAKKYGVGTKWGLFGTYIPHRVGYQCSNYYRSHFIEGGIIWDGNFMLDKYGKSIYMGRKGKGKNLL